MTAKSPIMTPVTWAVTMEAGDVGAEVLVTACPYCITHFEDSRLALEDSEDGTGIEIKDITEIIQEVI